MKKISIDLETFSTIDLGKCGHYKYSESADFEILLFGYSIDDGPVTVIDLASGEEIPPEIINALTDNTIQKWAYHAAFERVCLSRWLQRHGYSLHNEQYAGDEEALQGFLDPAGWRCTMVWASYLALPRSLHDVGLILNLTNKKMDEGKDLIRYFCLPCAPTKTNGGRVRNLPGHAPDKWDTFVSYNKRDVEVEMEIQKRLSAFPVPEFIWDEYHMDQKINDRGIMIDMSLVEQALRIDALTKESLRTRMLTLTGLENPNSVMQMKGWLSLNGVETESLDKKAVNELLPSVQPEVADVLACRQQLAKSSVSKYTAMKNAVCSDDRARGMFVFYGAARTGRYCGKHIQLQNLPQNHMPDLAEARQLVRDGDFATLEMLYDNIPQVLSELIRTAFIPKPGNKFIVADFSAIEARVLSFLAGEQWRIDLFASGGDIYCKSASQMFHVPVVKNGENGHLRQKGKIAELACLAEDEPVLTDSGLVPIQNVTPEMLVWDGDNWVHHDGAVYRGRREIISYQGLSATPDHVVYVLEQTLPLKLITAAVNGYTLVHSGPENDEPDDLHFRLSETYDLVNAGPYHRFTASGHLVHNCGYGGSVGALKAMGALEMGLQEEELKPLVDAWRTANPAIVQFWWDVDKAVRDAVSKKLETTVEPFRFRCRSGMLFIDLPSGRHLTYVKPKMGIDQFGRDSVTYEGTNTGKWSRLETYGPKIVENCVAGGTMVLTDRGLVAIEQITESDLIWDGVEWVHHEGLINRGVRETVRVDGISMTPEHRILTKEGWKAGADCEGSYWAEVQSPDGLGTGAKYSSEEVTMVLPLRLRENSAHPCKTLSGQTAPVKILWLYDQTACWKSKYNTWNESSSCMGSLALNETALWGSESSSLSKLWRPWYNRLSRVGAFFRTVLEGYGAYLSSRFGARPYRQREGVLSRQLPLGDQKGEQSKSSLKSGNRYSLWKDDSSRTVRDDWNREYNDSVSFGARVADRISVRKTKSTEPVYDIRNCGPRHRFTVYDPECGKLRIISNCTQAVARDILAYAIGGLARWHIVGHVHDEVIVECPEDTSLDEICTIMGRTPPWIPGLLLRADGYECGFYMKE